MYKKRTSLTLTIWQPLKSINQRNQIKSSFVLLCSFLGAIINIRLSVYLRRVVLVVCRTDQTSAAQGLFRWVRAQSIGHNTLGSSKNASAPHRHSPKKGRLGRQAINIAPPKRVKAWGDDTLRLEGAGLGEPQLTATGTSTHPTRSVYQRIRPAVMCLVAGLEFFFL